MTKLTFDVDFTKDPEEILKEIQERAREEVAKRESKEKAHAYLTRLHEVVNKEIGTSYKSLSDLIRALSNYTKGGAVRDKVAKTSPSGRRITISMNQEIYEKIKSLIAQPNPNKAAIARETGVSVVQVRKVAAGGYDNKFGSNKSSQSSKAVAPTAKPAPAPPIAEPAPIEDKTALSPPPAPEVIEEAPTAPLAPPPAPTLDLPPTPSIPEPAPIEDESTLPPPPAPEVIEEAPPAPLAPPPTPTGPTSHSFHSRTNSNRGRVHSSSTSCS